MASSPNRFESYTSYWSNLNLGPKPLTAPAPRRWHAFSNPGQYTSGAFRGLLERHGMRQSLAAPGQCWDNAVAESFWSTLKEELVYQHSWPTRARARQAIFEFVEVFYNRERLHSSLGYLSPAEYEARGRGQGKAVNAA